MRRFIFNFLVLILFLFAASNFLGQPAAAEPARLALLIGNSGYDPRVGALRNPVKDVALIGEALARLGFNVSVVKDADFRAIDTAIKRFADEAGRAGPGTVTFVYYSGHGAANPRTKVNYIIPIDVTDPEDQDFWYHSYEQSVFIATLTRLAPLAVHFVIFDACRSELHFATRDTKSIGDEKGFVPVQSSAGLLVAYSTAPDRTASDVGHEGGPYARVLAEEILKPGYEAVSMFRSVQIRMKQQIGQDPWLSFPALPPIYLNGLPIDPESEIEERLWTLAQRSDSPRLLDSYVEQYPKGRHISEARALADRIRAEQNEETVRQKAEQKRLALELERSAAAEAELRQKLASADAANRTLESAARQYQQALQAATEEAQTASASGSDTLQRAQAAEQAAKQALSIAQRQRDDALKQAEDARAAADRTRAAGGEASAVADRTAMLAGTTADGPAEDADALRKKMAEAVARKKKVEAEANQQALENLKKKTEIKLGRAANFNRQCESIPPPNITVTRQPKYGTIVFKISPEVVDHVNRKALEHCTGKILPSRVAYFHVREGLGDITENDYVQLRVDLPSGTQVWDYTIELGTRTAMKTKVTRPD